MRVNYSLGKPPYDELQRMPLLPVTLFYGGQELEVTALVDSGAMMNVIPYRVGLEMGLVWDDSQTNISLGGAFRGVPAMSIVIGGQIGDFPPMTLLFAWSRSDNVRVILGQFNFFQEFEVHFYRSKFEFEINPKAD